MNVPYGGWRLTYAGTDITAELNPFILEISYTEFLEGESDELSVNIEDMLHRFKGDWWFSRGDLLELAIGYAGDELVRIGVFEVDEIEFSGPPDEVWIRCLAAGAQKSLRTGKTNAYEDKTLRQIAEEVAGRNGLTLVGSGDAPGRSYKRITQHEESDLAFLNRLGEDEGIVFTVKDGKLIWHDKDTLDAASEAITLQRTDMDRFRFTVAAATTYCKCMVSYHDPESNELITHTETDPNAESRDTLKLTVRCENLEQAKGKARAGLKAANVRKIQGWVSLEGDPRLRAGVNIGVQGFRRLDGRYQIKMARHRYERSSSQGYSTEIDLASIDGDTEQ